MTRERMVMQHTPDRETEVGKEDKRIKDKKKK